MDAAASPPPPPRTDGVRGPLRETAMAAAFAAERAAEISVRSFTKDEKVAGKGIACGGGVHGCGAEDGLDERLRRSGSGSRCRPV